MASHAGAPEVIVVGAGPVGLCVALALARDGREVLVLEKEPTTAQHSRAPGIWPRTQEILSELGIVQAFLAQGITIAELRIHDADRNRPLLSIPLTELADSTDFPQLLILPQSRTEALLCEAVQRERTARVLFSAEVVGIRQSGAVVSVNYRRDGATRSIDAPFAVACDGARSTVREQLSISLAGETYDTRITLADIEAPGLDDLPFPRISTRHGLALGIRIGGGLWRLILPFRGSRGGAANDRIEEAAIDLFPPVTSRSDYATVWQSEFTIHRRVAGEFVRGRIALAGDAAHLNSPVGGQGMNAGIQDAEALAHALGHALDAGEPAPLERYAHERRARVEGNVNRFTDRLTRVLLLGQGRAIRPALFLARQALRLPPVRRRLLERVSMLDQR